MAMRRVIAHELKVSVEMIHPVSSNTPEEEAIIWCTSYSSLSYKPMI
jgi:hypothetical protein